MKQGTANLITVSSELGAPGRTAGAVLLDGYMLYMPEEGLGLESFVARGGPLIREEERETLLRDLLGLDEKIEELRAKFPMLSRQLHFLTDFVVKTRGRSTARPRNEALFALIYCAKECDLTPGSSPQIESTDDAAVAELVLARNAAAFRAHCRTRGLDWSAIAGSGTAAAGCE